MTRSPGSSPRGRTSRARCATGAPLLCSSIPVARGTTRSASRFWGGLIEIWSGQRLDQFISERILAPLGMSDTDWYCPPKRRSDWRCSTQLQRVAVPIEEIGNEFLKEPTLFLGGGGLVSTAGDFQRFMSMLRVVARSNGTHS